MKQRSPATSLLLSLFVPFYYLYWLHATGRSMNTRGVKAPSILLILAPVLLLIGAFLLMLVARMAGNLAGLNILVMLLGILAVPALVVLPIIFDLKFSQAVEKATNSQISAGTGFVLMFFIAPAAVYIFQDKLNRFEAPAQQGDSLPQNQFPQQAGSPAFASNQPQQQVQPPQPQQPSEPTLPNQQQ